MPARRPPPSRCFLLIDPLRPPSDNGPFGRLASIVSGSTTWFFARPVTDRKINPSDGEPRTLLEIEEAVEAAPETLREAGIAVEITRQKSAYACDRRGYLLVDNFCQKHIRKERAFARTLSTGRTINQRQLLSAMALYHADQVARTAASGDVR